ncbi:short chain dehydrogenase reductase family superfamily [Diplodia corticola]|uniref:Short chain dehydrogenase reductase family superfamily n=1 Tax=Diplodia corticola TaxID=236234 RepID=A0A1J9R651_9PEZI|nr:short chain dehydrogenase reductase family superfamily [Diplodia corticola]OJD35674.1 short chain dehydrogenase reductase family superfamily [Diplodia corticola]
MSSSHPHGHESPQRVLVVGASRGLGASLLKQYTEGPSSTIVFGTARQGSPPTSGPQDVTWLPNIDVSGPEAGTSIVDGYKSHSNSPIDILIITAGYFGKESFDAPSYDAQVSMYKISAIAPTLIVSALTAANLLRTGSKVILVSSESGSITLRHESEGGGNFGHHASKAALNMVGKLLSIDLKDKGVAVGLVHPGFMRTEMTKSVGFDKFWDDGGAVTPDEAAQSLAEWIDTFDISKTGEYWAPRGPGDIGTAEPVLGSKDKLSTPLQLPW